MDTRDSGQSSCWVCTTCTYKYNDRHRHVFCTVCGATTDLQAQKEINENSASTSRTSMNIGRQSQRQIQHLSKLWDRRYYGGKILNNRLRNFNTNDVSFQDLVDPRGLEAAIISTLNVNERAVETIFGKCLNGLYHKDFTLVQIENYNRSYHETTGSILQIRERMIIIRPHFRTNPFSPIKKYGIQHSKFMLLRYEDRFR